MLVVHTVGINYPRPIRVQTATFKAVVTHRTCTAVDEALLQLAEDNRPLWEKREWSFTR